MKLDPFYPIVDSAAWIARLVGVGVRLIQLRIKDRPEAEVSAEAREALAICSRYGAQLILNDYWRLAIDIGAGFIHLGQEDLEDADMIAIRARGIRVGISTHDEAELERALSRAPDYVALGPIYPTILKAMKFGPQGLERIGLWKKRVGQIPLVAIGGLNVERGKLCLAAGADIVSAVTDITLNADPEARARVDRGDARAMSGRSPIAMTIAGSDSGGGAGVQADLKTFAALGVYGASAITALTAQNTLGVAAIHLAPPEFVVAEMDAILGDFRVGAIKIGMLGSAEIAEAVGRRLALDAVRPFLVYDPVMIASTGDPLAGEGFVEAIQTHLLPLVDCLTPNLSEAAVLLGCPVARNEAEMTSQARALVAQGPRAVLMKGGHLEGEEATDFLVTRDTLSRFAATRIASRNLHGTGCTLSSAVAARVALGEPLTTAVGAAKTFVRTAIERAKDFRLGIGPGPLLQFKTR